MCFFPRRFIAFIRFPKEYKIENTESFLFHVDNMTIMCGYTHAQR